MRHPIAAVYLRCNWIPWSAKLIEDNELFLLLIDSGCTSWIEICAIFDPPSFKESPLILVISGSEWLAHYWLNVFLILLAVEAKLLGKVFDPWMLDDFSIVDIVILILLHNLHDFCCIEDSSGHSMKEIMNWELNLTFFLKWNLCIIDLSYLCKQGWYNNQWGNQSNYKHNQPLLTCNLILPLSVFLDLGSFQLMALKFEEFNTIP